MPKKIVVNRYICGLCVLKNEGNTRYCDSCGAHLRISGARAGEAEVCKYRSHHLAEKREKLPGLVQQKVILVGLDRVVPACRISVGLEPLEAERTIVDVLRKDSVPIRECIRQISGKLRVVNAIIDLTPMEMELLSRASREKILDRALRIDRRGAD